jgi:hypothetical protein
LNRLPPPVFWLVALSAGLAGATALFVIVGLTVDALTQSSAAISLSALGAGLVGFVAPVLYLGRARSGPKQPNARQVPPPLSTVQDIKWSLAPSAESQTPIGPAEWFYAEAGKRLGPVSAEQIHRLVADGSISRATLIWRAGMADWVKIADSELAEQAPPTVPPPLSSTGIGNGWIWALALAPFWGAILHYGGVYAYLAFAGEPRFFWDVRAEQLMWKTWYVEVALNGSLALADEQSPRSAGWKSDKLNKWLAILVPVYIYKRDQLVGANMTRFWVWICAVVLSAIVI